MTTRRESSLLCLIGCIVFGLIAGGLSWFLLQSLLGSFALLLVALFVAAVTAWMLYEACCGGRAEEAATIATATGATTMASAVSSTAAAGDNKKPLGEAKKSSKSKTAAKSVSTSKSKKSSSSAKPKTSAKSKSKSTAGPKLYKSRPSKVDDLKMIAGVGPKLEGVLHDVGVYQYAQIAGWKKKDIAYVDERLKFKGRIEREEWVKQAKALAKGGEAEYIKVFGKKPR